VALTPDLARAALEDRAHLGQMLGVHVPQTWPGADFARMLPRLAQGFEHASSGTEPTRLIVHERDRVLIGETGFHGPPDGSGRSRSATASSRRIVGRGSRPRRHVP